MERTWLRRHKNGSAISSSQQLYLHDLLGGILNYPVGTASLDIAFPDEMIYLEYDGSGHNLSVKIGQMTQSEFDHRQRRRTYKLYRAGWRAIRIISSKDYLPHGSEILDLITQARKSIGAGSSFFEIDIDNAQ